MTSGHAVPTDLDRYLALPSSQQQEVDVKLELIQGVGFSALLALASGPDEETSSRVLAALKLVMEGDSGLQILRDPMLMGYFSAGVSQPVPPVQRFTCHAIQRLVESEQDAKTMAAKYHLFSPTSVQIESGVLPTLADQLGGEDVGVADDVTNCLATLSTHTCGLEYIYRNDEVVKAIGEIASKSSVLQFRVLNLHIEIAVRSEAGLNAAVTRGNLLKDLLAIVDSDDILGKATAIELLAKLGLNLPALQLLEKEELISHLVGQIGDPFLDTPILHFLDSVGKKSAAVEVLIQTSNLLSALQAAYESSVENKAGVISFLSSIAQFPSGLEYIFANAKQLLLEILNNVFGTQAMLKAACFHLLGQMLSCSCCNDELFEIFSTHQSQGRTITDVLVSVANEPYPENRGAALRLMLSMTNRPFSVKQLVGHLDFMPFATNRDIVLDADSLALKRDLISKLKKDPLVVDIIGETKYKQLVGIPESEPRGAPENVHVATASR